VLKDSPSVLNLSSGLGLDASGAEIGGQDPEVMLEDQWLARSRDAFRTSTDWFDTVVRPQITKNIAHFKSKHPRLAD
jgi:hypothetical protein